MLKAIASTTTKARRSQGSDVPDLQTQLESLLDQIWRSEAEWTL